MATGQHCEFRFHGELNAFLAPSRRHTAVLHRFDGTPSIKDQVEALGVPHTEVGALLVDGRAVGFDYLLRGGEQVAVHPGGSAIAAGAAGSLRPERPAEPRFIADVHLGRLASYLRLLGFDCAWRNDLSDDDVLATANAEHRVVLTRDTGLLKRATLVHGAFVHATDPRRQLREVFTRFDLDGRTRPFTRCGRCNGTVSPWRPEASTPLPEAADRYRDRLSRCTGCGQVYWPGSHVDRLRQRLAEAGVAL